ncbi:YitT family protein [Neobacillus cucumis]|uniref:YitT family protein n=1 Tax=Neobacillus cucumis TaxID=1740721 RepID=UPI002853384B|nr:YitT family protein [Neobacillus cucumis]MDR4947056.1 YitT family protein [Neobacillus cucumis]
MHFLKKGLVILFGSILLSIGINFFLVPFELLDGGIIGVGLIIKYLTGMKPGLAIIFLSIPIFALAWFYNKSYFYNSLFGMLFSSFVIDLLSFSRGYIQLQIPPVVSSVLGGIFVGLGIGIMLRYETSTGGTDLLAQFLSKIFKINVGIMIFIIDALVICLGGMLISKETFFLSSLTITVVGLFTSLCTWNDERTKLKTS